MNFDELPILSRFQILNRTVLEFLKSEQKKSDNEKLIYSHQIEALLAVREYFHGIHTPDRAALIVAPTGAGKTGIVTLLPYVLASPKVMILSPSLIITDQLGKAFGLRNDVAKESFVFERGIITDEAKLNNFLEMGKIIDVTEAIRNMKKWNLVIVNAQKFVALKQEVSADEKLRKGIIEIKENFSAFTTLIVDEAHHYPAETWDMIVNEFKGKQLIFLTATPFRGSDRQELWHGQEITYNISKQTLVSSNIIRDLIYEDIDCDIGQYDIIMAYICRILAQHDQIEPAVKHKAMVLTLTTDEAEKGARAMNENATYYTSEKKTERNLKKFENSTCRILFVCGRLLEGKIYILNQTDNEPKILGYDNSDVSLCIILRKVGVLGLFTQFVGRCVRKSKQLPDKRVDPVTAIVASLLAYKQRQNYEDYMKN